jgi:hypothetical protein
MADRERPRLPVLSRPRSVTVVVVSSIDRLVGVYDADGTLRGELAYLVGSRLGNAHCSLCDITHGTLRAKPEWRRCREALPVAFDTYHRNDQPDAVRAATGDTAPVVVAETSDGIVTLLDDDALDACNGSVDAMVAALTEAVERAGLAW